MLPLAKVIRIEDLKLLSSNCQLPLTYRRRTVQLTHSHTVPLLGTHKTSTKMVSICARRRTVPSGQGGFKSDKSWVLPARAETTYSPRPAAILPQ